MLQINSAFPSRQQDANCASRGTVKSGASSIPFVGPLIPLYVSRIKSPEMGEFKRTSQTVQRVPVLPHQPGGYSHWVQSLNGRLAAGQNEYVTHEAQIMPPQGLEITGKSRTSIVSADHLWSVDNEYCAVTSQQIATEMNLKFGNIIFRWTVKWPKIWSAKVTLSAVTRQIIRFDQYSLPHHKSYRITLCGNDMTSFAREERTYEQPK